MSDTIVSTAGVATGARRTIRQTAGDPTLAANPSGYGTKQAARAPSTWATAPHTSH